MVLGGYFSRWILSDLHANLLAEAALDVVDMIAEVLLSLIHI